MSRENVEIVQRAYADPGGLTALADLLAPDAEFDFSDAYPDAPVIRGLDEMRRFRDAGPWAEIHFEPEEWFDVDDERVLVFVRFESRGRGSDVPVQARPAHEITIREGRLVRFKVYSDRDEALQAVGLSPS